MGQTHLEVVYIANDGFLIESSNKKVLIDALFGGWESDWCDVPSANTMGEMERAAEPFDHIDVILISHSHMDHFSPNVVARHLENNPVGVLICPSQVVRKLKECENYQGIRQQVTEITPEYGSMVELEVNGVGIRVLRLAHAPYYVEDKETGEKRDVHNNVQNLGFVINMDGVKVFHGGDWGVDNVEKHKAALLGGNEYVDVAFLGVAVSWPLFEPRVKSAREYVKPKHIVLMHLLGGEVEGVAEEQREALSDVVIFTKSRDGRVLD